MLILFLLAATMLVVYIREKIASYSVKAVFLKSVVSVLFITVAILGWYLSNRGILGIFVIIGLTFGLLGDIWLDLKYVFRDYDDQFHLRWVCLIWNRAYPVYCRLIGPVHVRHETVRSCSPHCSWRESQPLQCHAGKAYETALRKNEGHRHRLRCAAFQHGSVIRKSCSCKGLAESQSESFLCGRCSFCSFRFGTERNILRRRKRTARRYRFKLHSLLWRPVSDRIFSSLSLIISFAPLSACFSK